MKAYQKLVHNGNATSVSIPRVMLVQLGWLAGQRMIVEMLEDQSVRVRRPVAEDFGLAGPPQRLLPELHAVKP